MPPRIENRGEGSFCDFRAEPSSRFADSLGDPAPFVVHSPAGFMVHVAIQLTVGFRFSNAGFPRSSFEFSSFASIL